MQDLKIFSEDVLLDMGGNKITSKTSSVEAARLGACGSLPRGAVLMAGEGKENGTQESGGM